MPETKALSAEADALIQCLPEKVQRMLFNSGVWHFGGSATISYPNVVNFVQTTGDTNPIHQDPLRAENQFPGDLRGCVVVPGAQLLACTTGALGALLEVKERPECLLVLREVQFKLNKPCMVHLDSPTVVFIDLLSPGVVWVVRGECLHITILFRVALGEEQQNPCMSGRIVFVVKP